MENEPKIAVSEVERLEIENKYELVKIMTQASRADEDIKKAILATVEHWRNKVLAGERNLIYGGFSITRDKIRSSSRPNKTENEELLNAVEKTLGT